MPFRVREIAGVALAISAIFFLNAPCYPMTSDLLAFGNFGSLANPANIDPSTVTRAEGTFYNIVYNNVIPAISYYGDKTGPLFRGDKGFIKESKNYELYFSSRNFAFSYALTENYDYNATGDTVRLLQHFNDNSHPVGESFDVGLTALEEKEEEAKLYYCQELAGNFVKNLRVGICAKILQGSHYANGGIAGDASQENETTTNFNFNLDTYLTKPVTVGRGIGVDLGMTCQVNEALSLEMILENLAAQMEWLSLKKITATGNSGNVIVDGNGNIINNPTISGYKFEENLSKRPLFKSIWGAKYKQSDQLSFITILEPYTDVTYYWVGSEWKPLQALKISAGYGSKFEAASLGVEWGFLKCLLSTNDLSLSEARSLGLLIGISL